MSARIVVAFSNREYMKEMSATLRRLGHTVAAFTDGQLALQAAKDSDVLITQVRLPPGRPHGLSLARMAKRRRPSIRVLFVGLPEMQPYLEQWSYFVPTPATISDVAAAVERLLRTP